MAVLVVMNPPKFKIRPPRSRWLADKETTQHPEATCSVVTRNVVSKLPVKTSYTEALIVSRFDD
jgi:hypothetical protein